MHSLGIGEYNYSRNALQFFRTSKIFLKVRSHQRNMTKELVLGISPSSPFTVHTSVPPTINLLVFTAIM